MIAILLIGILMAGCSDTVSVKKVDINQRFQTMNENAVNTGDLSERSKMFLRMRDLTAAWENDPLRVILQVDEKYWTKPDRETLFTLMEFCFYRAQKEAKNSPESARYYRSTMIYAYTYLFDEKLEDRPGPYHPHSRLVCDFYNNSLAELLIYHRDTGIRVNEGEPISSLTAEIIPKMGKSDFLWKPRDLERYFVAYEFQPQGLDDHIKSFGVGVPCLGLKKPSPRNLAKKEELYMPNVDQTYGATLLVRITPIPASGGKMQFSAEVDMYDPFKTREVTISNKPVPLENDFTIPIAYTIQQMPANSGIGGLFDAAAWDDQKGLFMLQPYDEKKIPVVFVHGLLSSPETWMRMFNNLMASPKIREKYQFWFFKYPTGNPIVYSASVLRQSLQQIQNTYDPQGKSPYFNRMILVGHSMGGLLSKTMIQDGGDKIWKFFSDKPFETYNFTPEEKEMVTRLIYFKSLPFVSRVVFIATPHRGSDLATYRITEFLTSFIKLPFVVAQTSFNALSKMAMDEKSQIKYSIDRMPTGVDGLKPDSPFVKISTSLPMTYLLPYHSIIGNENGDTPGGTDGIVPYESSHLDGAISEKIVHSGHSAHNHPLAVLEVQRILLEHLVATSMDD
jgi:triacylglycerol esterase/lipase EstA (alpha/beta hydrolase family)